MTLPAPLPPEPETTRPGGPAKEFFRSLLDFSFTSFVTLKFVRLLYTIGVVLAALMSVALFITFLMRGEAGFILLALVVPPVLLLVQVVVLRIALEIVAIQFRIGENTSILARTMSTPPPPHA